MKTKFFMAALLVAVFTGCSEKNSYEDTSLKKSEVADNVSNGYANGSAEQSMPEAAEEERNAAATETSDKSANQQAGGFISSSAARVNSDTSRKFVRTANMRFRVKDVRQSTFDIEDIVDGFGGFVSYTTLNSSVSSRTEIPVSKDSILITTRYTVSNNMTIRIPNEKLDSALRSIAKHMEFLDYRTITAQDVTLQLISNKLMRSRLNRHSQRLNNAIDNRGKKLGETGYAEDNLLNRQMQSDQMLMENMRIMADVEYSTIQLDFYQHETVQRELKFNDEDIEEYTPGFGSKLLDGLAMGWEFILELLIGIITLWPLWIGVAVIWLVIRRAIRNRKSV
jgi:hypothetical protein